MFHEVLSLAQAVADDRRTSAAKVASPTTSHASTPTPVAISVGANPVVGSANVTPPTRRGPDEASFDGSSRVGDSVAFCELAGELWSWDASCGGGSNQPHGGEQCVAPVVVGAPPHHLIEQVRFQTGTQGCAREIAIGSCVSRGRGIDHSGRWASSRPSYGIAVSRLMPARSRASAASSMNSSPGKVLFFGWRSATAAASSCASAPFSRPDSSRRIASTVVLGSSASDVQVSGEPRFVSWRVQPTTPPRRRRVPYPD